MLRFFSVSYRISLPAIWFAVLFASCRVRVSPWSHFKRGGSICPPPARSPVFSSFAPRSRGDDFSPELGSGLCYDDLFSPLPGLSSDQRISFFLVRLMPRPPAVRPLRFLPPMSGPRWQLCLSLFPYTVKHPWGEGLNFLGLACVPVF